MKKNFFLVAALAAGMALNAQYTQTLPLDYNDFFRAEALNADGEHLEVYTYANSDQKSSSKPNGEELHGDQWNCSGKATDQKGENPVVAASTLEFGNYVDNKKGKEIILANLPLDGSSSITRASIYSLQRSYEYSEKPYYLAALVQINEATGKGDILTMDGNYTANAQRGRMFVNKEGKGYKLGLGWNGEPAAEDYTGELAFGSTHLVVIKMIPCGNASGVTESAMLWVDPDMTKTEAENVAVSTLADQTAGLKSVRGITIRQRSKISGKIAGLRFSDNWADVVKAAEAGPSTGMDEINAEMKARKVFVNGQMLIERNGEYFNMTGAKVL